jgi:hypothetical protein
MKISYHISESLVTPLRVKFFVADPDAVSRIFFNPESGWKNSDPG